MSDHAIRNGTLWLAGIVAAIGRLNEATTAGNHETADAVREEINQEPLSVEVRSDWHTPGSVATPGEFCILLSTGGPALRIIGDLDEYGQPYGDPSIQWQDWGTPWTSLPTTREEANALGDYARCFYFEE
jgi:hypothetical protein